MTFKLCDAATGKLIQVFPFLTPTTWADGTDIKSGKNQIPMQIPALPPLKAMSWSAAQPFAALILATLSLCTPLAAQASDKPFLRTTQAVVEDDDERSFEISASVLSGRYLRETGLQVAYNISSTLSVEAQWSQAKLRTEGLSSREQELEVWKSWVDPAREGWGLASSLSVERGRESGERWESPDYQAMLAYSRPWADKSVWLHANLGTRYTFDEDGRRRWAGVWALGLQHQLTKQFGLFAEVAGADGGRDRLAQAGARYWIKREKIALDLGVGRHFAAEQRGNFGVLTLSFYDLSP